MPGYDPKDSEGTRISKACSFYRSMVRKGQPTTDALRISSYYYHVSGSSVKSVLELCEEDDDVYFMLGGHTPVSASEMFDPGDFC